MFEREVKALKPAPPLVFDLDALRAARQNSRYMIEHGLTPGKSQFVAKGFSERMRKAGFTGSPRGENCFLAARSPANSNFAFIVDFCKGGPGGMQPGRGHRMNMINARCNVVGPSAVPHGDRLSVTHNFGSRKGRFAGGVYGNRNRNGSYDVGEGRGGVTVRSADGKYRCVTWDSGAYTLPIGAGSGGLVAEWNGLSYAGSLPDGQGNVKFDWLIPVQADLNLADRLIEDARSASGRSTRATAVALLLRSGELGLDPERRAAIDGLTAGVAMDFEQVKAPVLAAIAEGDGRALKAALREGAKAFRGTMAATRFAQAALLGKAGVGVDGVERASAAGPVAAAQTVDFADLKTGFAALISRVDAAGRPIS